ncbi:MAG: hypothetical protein H6608_07815 [Flavobacteriales bacterium]|nr:hypothetical protein [Flavobacteriales bacterium]
MKHLLFTLVMMLQLVLPVIGQTEVDSVLTDTLRADSTVLVDTIPMRVDSLELKYGVKLFDTIPDLAEAVMEALRSRKFEDLTPFIATVEMIKVEYDTLDLAYLNRLAGVKYQYMYNQLRKQHVKVVTYAKRYHLNLKMMELVRHRYRERVHPEGHEYAEVTYLCRYGRHSFYISFVAIKIIDRWFLADELKIEELLEPSESGRR